MPRRAAAARIKKDCLARRQQKLRTRPAPPPMHHGIPVQFVPFRRRECGRKALLGKGAARNQVRRRPRAARKALLGKARRGRWSRCSSRPSWESSVSKCGPDLHGEDAGAARLMAAGNAGVPVRRGERGMHGSSPAPELSSGFSKSVRGLIRLRQGHHAPTAERFERGVNLRGFKFSLLCFQC